MKTILITGASGGLGTTVTRHFIEQGHRVLAIVGSEASRQQLPRHDHLHVYIADLTEEKQVAELVAQMVQEQGPIQGALLLAGGFAMGAMEDTGLDEIRKMLAINFETAYTIARPLFARMLEQNEGRIVFTGARPALQPSAGSRMLAYSLSKSLLFRLAECLNEEAKGKNVSVSVLVPSTIDTPANRKAMPHTDPADWVTPEEIAAILDFFLSDTAGPLRETVIKAYKNS